MDGKTQNELETMMADTIIKIRASIQSSQKLKELFGVKETDKELYYYNYLIEQMENTIADITIKRIEAQDAE